MIEARLFYDGQWRDGERTASLLDKYHGAAVATVHEAGAEQVEAALQAVAAGQRESALTPYERYRILARASELVAQQRDRFVTTVIQDSGFTVSDAQREVDRAAQTLLISAEEAKRIHGEVVPFDGAPGWTGGLGFTTRHPLGVVAAITPFNSPLDTVAHKVAPAIAQGTDKRAHAHRQHGQEAPDLALPLPARESTVGGSDASADLMTTVDTSVTRHPRAAPAWMPIATANGSVIRSSPRSVGDHIVRAAADADPHVRTTSVGRGCDRVIVTEGSDGSQRYVRPSHCEQHGAPRRRDAGLARSVPSVVDVGRPDRGHQSGAEPTWPSSFRSPGHVILTGKRNKSRIVPLTDRQSNTYTST